MTNRLLPLALAVAISTTIAGFSQVAQPPPAAPSAPATVVSLPTDRTLTDTGGRKIEVTILDKTATGIKAELNGKTFNIALNTLTAEDQAFIAGCKTYVPPSKKLLYVITDTLLPADHTNVELLKTAGYTVTFGYSHDDKLERPNAFGKNTPESQNSANLFTAKGYGIYWFASPGRQGNSHPTDGKWAGPSDRINSDERKLIGSLLQAGQTVIINSVQDRPYRWYISNPDIPTYQRPTPVYTKTEKNLITYNNQEPTLEINPTIIPKVMKELQKSL